jgi:hypothetical protein
LDVLYPALVTALIVIVGAPHPQSVILTEPTMSVACQKAVFPDPSVVVATGALYCG